MQQSDVTQINERISALLSSPEFEKLLAGTNLHQELSQVAHDFAAGRDLHAAGIAGQVQNHQCRQVLTTNYYGSSLN